MSSPKVGSSSTSNLASMAMVNARCTWVFMPLDNSRMRRLPVISVFASNADGPVAAESRMHAGDEVDGLIDPQPAGQHRDVGNEAGIVHERGAFAKRLAAQHVEPPFIGGETEDGAQRAGLARAVRADEADDAPGFHGKIGAIERNVRAVFLGQITSFDERGHGISHSSVGKPPRGGGAGWVIAGVCANSSCAENPSRMNDRQDLRPLLVQEPFAFSGQQ